VKTAEGEKVEARAESFVDAAEARKEWQALKKKVRREGFARHSILCLYKQVVEFCPNDFPNILKLVQCALTLPVHTADVERTFSCQNRVCTKLRNALLPATQDMLMRVSLEGPKMEEPKAEDDKEKQQKLFKQKMTDFVVEAVDKWASTRPRKLFSKR
jgi:hypothetical protein